MLSSCENSAAEIHSEYLPSLKWSSYQRLLSIHVPAKHYTFSIKFLEVESQIMFLQTTCKTGLLHWLVAFVLVLAWRAGKLSTGYFM